MEGVLPITVNFVLGKDLKISGRAFTKYFKPFKGISALAVVIILFDSTRFEGPGTNLLISIPFTITSILLSSTLNSSTMSSLEGLLTQIILFNLGATFFCIGKKLCHLIEESFSFQLDAFSISSL